MVSVVATCTASCRTRTVRSAVALSTATRSVASPFCTERTRPVAAFSSVSAAEVPPTIDHVSGTFGMTASWTSSAVAWMSKSSPRLLIVSMDGVARSPIFGTAPYTITCCRRVVSVSAVLIGRTVSTVRPRARTYSRRSEVTSTMPAASASTPSRNTTPTPLAVSVPVNGDTVSPMLRFWESGLTSKLYSTGGTGTTRSHCTVTTASAALTSASSARRNGKPRPAARTSSVFTNPTATRQPLARARPRGPACTPSGFRR